MKRNKIKRKKLSNSRVFYINNMDFRNHNHHTGNSLGTAGNMAEMEDKLGMDAVLPMHFPLIPLLIPLIVPPQMGHQRKRIVDLDEGFCFCIRTLGIPPFCLAYYFICKQIKIGVGKRLTYPKKFWSNEKKTLNEFSKMK
jgi:hypothetical protein